MTTAPGCAMLNRKLFITRTANPYRNLFERWWTGEEWLWIDHGRPGGTDVIGEPGAAMLDEKLFVTVDDGSIWERHWRPDLDRWAWEAHGRPANRKVRHGPAAPMMNEKFFVVDEDGSLWERHWRIDLSRWAWFEHGRPEDRRIVAAPGAEMLGEKLFVVVDNGNLWERHWRSDLNRWAWSDHGRPDGKSIAYAPGAAMMNEKLFVVTNSGELYERHWRSDLSRWAWQAHGRPDGVSLCSAPGAAMANTRLFVAGSDGGLHQRSWNGSAWVWTDHGRPPGTRVATAPGAAMLDSKLFVGASNGQMFELFNDGRSWVWVAHGRPIEDNRSTVISSDGARHVIAVIGDGYDENNIDSFRDYVRREIVDGVFGRDLFAELRNRFTVHRIDAYSIDDRASTRRYNEQGTPNEDNDDTVEAEDIRNTRLKCVSTGSWSHCWIDRTADFITLRDRILQRFASDWDFCIVVLNDSQPGGCAQGNQQWITRSENWATLAHEFGHQIGGLDDEYTRSNSPFNDGPGFNRPNCSVSPNALPAAWAAMVDAGTALPTDANNLPAGFDRDTDIGAFEGCSTNDTGVFRPSLRCRMDNNSPPFCGVCEAQMRDRIG